MKKDYWNVSDEQVIEKTGKTLDEWTEVLPEFHAIEKKSNGVVNYLQTELALPRFWARTLTTRFIKEQKGEL